MKTPERKSAQVEPLITAWQQCPLCPGHLDESDGFRWNDLLNAPVCHGCSYDIHFALVGEDERPLVSPGHNYSDTNMGRLEQLTGQTFHQLKYRHLREEIISRSGTEPEYVTGIDFMALSDSELRLVNKCLDDELLELIETRRVAHDEVSKFENFVFEGLKKDVKGDAA